MIPHLAWSVIITVKTNFIIWETRDWSWKPANFSKKPLAETQWKWADTFKSTEALPLRKHETMPPFSSYTFPVETVLRKRNGILNHQVSATFPNCGNTLFHPVILVLQNRRILQTLRLCPWPYIQSSEKFCDFVEQYLLSLLYVSPVHLLKCPYFQGALSSADDGYCAYWS